MPENSHVVVVGNYSADGQWSMQKFADLMHGSLERRGGSFEFLRPLPVCSRLARGPGALAKWLGYVDKFVLFPRQLRKTVRAHRGAFVHICDHSNSMYVRHLAGVPHLVTCHDLIAVRQAAGEFKAPAVAWTGRRLQAMIVNGLRRAHWVACDSESTRRDLVGKTGRTTRTETILCQLNYPYRRIVRHEAMRVLAGRLPAEGGAWVVHVGNNSWYKNRDGVLRIFAEARRQLPEAAPRLLIIGRDLTPKQEAFITREGLTGCVHRMADASTEELQAAYSLGDAFLFPSLYEGFGWPPIEAQACGCPVVAGNGGSLAEVLGDSALAADGQDDARLAGFLADVLRDPELRARLSENGYRNIERFKAPRMVDEYVKLYGKILAEAEC